jgi:hypothetical protein
MLTGSADIETLAGNAATIPKYFAEPIVFQHTLLLQTVMEMRNGAREAVLPPSLHPTVPPTLSMQVWQVGESPWGAFAMAVARVSCRGGVRARGFTTGVAASTDAAIQGLRDHLGYPARRADVAFTASYSGVEASVAESGQETYQASAIDPVPLGADDVQYTGTLNLAHTPNGLRLVQVEFHLEPQRVERLQARLQAFAPAAWGNRRLDPYHVVAASLAGGTVTFPPLRFLLRPDELAFTGTERIAGKT